MRHDVDHGNSVRHCDRFMYFQMYVCNMLVLPTLTQRLLNKKNNKSHLLTGVLDAGKTCFQNLIDENTFSHPINMAASDTR